MATIIVTAAATGLPVKNRSRPSALLRGFNAPPWPCVCLRAEDRGAAAAVGVHPAAVHARGVEGHHDVAGAVERDRAAAPAPSGHDQPDYVVGCSPGSD